MVDTAGTVQNTITTRNAAIIARRRWASGVSHRPSWPKWLIVPRSALAGRSATSAWPRTAIRDARRFASNDISDDISTFKSMSHGRWQWACWPRWLNIWCSRTLSLAARTFATLRHLHSQRSDERLREEWDGIWQWPCTPRELKPCSVAPCLGTQLTTP